MAELISVIVTTYNRADALEAVLRSLGRQTDQDFEVVVADDGSFRCARGCDGQGGNGGASSANWGVSLTFTQVGTVGYFCETHGMPNGGMFGTIIVQALTPVRLQSFVVD